SLPPRRSPDLPLPGRAALAPRPALRERLPPPDAARDEHRARRPGLALTGRAGRTGRLARARRGRPPAPPGSGRGDRLLLPPDDLGDGCCARPLPARGSAADVGEGGGDPLAGTRS